MDLSISLMATPAQDVVVSTSEPHPANPWEERFIASCGRQTLEIRIPRRPLGGSARVLLNGRPAQGDLDVLMTELTQASAAYRLSFVCAQNNETMQLNWVSGTASGHGEVRYRSGSAEFRSGAVIESHAGEANAETFWYR